MSGLSVIIPTFNRTRYLRDAVMSVLEQTVQAQEIILIDDGSAQKFEKDLQRIASLSPIIKLAKNEIQKGVSYSRNRGIEMANGEFISFLDDDDVLEQDFIMKGLEEFERHHEMEAISSQIELLGIDKSKSKWSQSTLKGDDTIDTTYLLVHCPMIHSFMFRKSVIEQFKFPEDLKYGEDMFLWMQMVNSGVNFKNADWVGGYFRIHENNQSAVIGPGEKINFCEKALDLGLFLSEGSKFLIAIRGFYWSLKNGRFSMKYFRPIVRHPLWSLKAIWKRGRIQL